MTDYTPPTPEEIKGYIDACDVEKLMALWEDAEEAVLTKAEEIDTLKEDFEDYERLYKTQLKTLAREQSRLKLNAKKLDSARFAAGRRQRIADSLARR